MLKVSDISFGCVGLLLCGYVWMESAGFPKDVIMKIGPEFFPRIVITALAVACLCLIAQGVMNKEVQDETDRLSLKDVGIQRAIAVLVLAIVYVTCMDFLGFIIATVITMMIMMYMLKLRNYLRMFLVSVCVAIFINFAFSGLLGIQLPGGLLDGII